jgi:hypothetical protein
LTIHTKDTPYNIVWRKKSIFYESVFSKRILAIEKTMLYSCRTLGNVRIAGNNVGNRFFVVDNHCIIVGGSANIVDKQQPFAANQCSIER